MMTSRMTDQCVNDCSHDSGANTDACHRQQPAGQKGTDNADDDIAEQPESEATHDQSGEPTGNATYDQPDDDAFNANGHVFPIHVERRGLRPTHCASRRGRAHDALPHGFRMTCRVAATGAWATGYAGEC